MLAGLAHGLARLVPEDTRRHRGVAVVGTTPMLKDDTLTGYASTIRERRDLALRSAKGCAPDHAAPVPSTTNPNRWSELKAG
jgi:hypothetical protein